MSDRLPPTRQRIMRARREGDVPVSRALTQAFAFLPAIVLVPIAAMATYTWSAERLIAAMKRPLEAPNASDFVVPVLELSGPLLVAVVAVSLLVGMIQTRGMLQVSTAPIHGAFGRGLARDAVVDMARVSLTAMVLLALFTLRIKDALPALAQCSFHAQTAIPLMRQLGIALALDFAMATIGIGIVDWFVVRISWRNRLGMSHAEVRREQRETRGDPLLQSARAKVHREPTLDEVMSKATVVITGHARCVVLRFKQGQDIAPVMLARGAGERFKQLVQMAANRGVAVVHAPHLVGPLADAPDGDLPNRRLYPALAEVFAKL